MIESTRLLRDLVALPSVNPMGRAVHGPDFFEHRVTDYLAEFFRSLGVPFERQAVAPLRENIIARSSATLDSRAVLFEAHQDTVPTDNMTIAPFAAVIENGRLYGRGACDIKGGMAAMLAAFARVVREKPTGSPGIVLACTVDEEHTFLGVQRLVQDPPKARLAIVAEPTQLQIVKAHKGVTRWHIVTRGRSCHSSAPEQGINAIYAMGQILPLIDRFARELSQGQPDSLLGPATLSVGIIEGGTSANTVPDRCRIEIDRRLIPGEDPQSAPKALHAFLRQQLPPDFPFESSSPWLHAPALGPIGSDEAVARLGTAIDKVMGSHQVTAVPYGTDASTIAQAGIPAVVFGPGDIKRAHTCDEWVPLDEVEQASEILFQLVRVANS